MMDMNLPALSLQQPWAWAILNAGKRIENRTWSTRYRGRLRLHAARTWDADGAAFIRQVHGYCPTHELLLRCGEMSALVGEVTVVDCVPFEDLEHPEDEPNRWAFGPICWVLTDAEYYAVPIPGRGYPGLFYPR